MSWMRGRRTWWKRGGPDAPTAVPVAEIDAVGDLLPAPRSSAPELTSRLVDRWCAASLAAGWATPGRWWHPTVDAVVEAVVDDTDHVAACADLAARRAADGATLAETLDDLGALFDAARLGSPPFATVRAVALAWATEARGRIEAAGCIDPRHGLCTVAYLDARLAELYREAQRVGHSPAETHALVVVELAGPDDGDPWDTSLRMSDVAQCLRTVFDGGQILGVAGPGRAVAVVSRACDLPRTVDNLRELLAEWRPPGVGSESPRIWVEGLPKARAEAGRLLGSLTA